MPFLSTWLLASVWSALLALSAGCASPRETPHAWLRDRGGALAGAGHDRAVRALGRLGQTGLPALTVTVADTADVGAFSWSSGQIVVTRGLLALVDDDELLAALAHEAGHLIGGSVAPAAALGGGECEHDADEMRADAAGARLLYGAGLDGSALIRLLDKVAGQPGLAGPAKARLLRRVESLRDAPAPVGTDIAGR